MLLIEVIIVDEGGHESLEIFELILMMKFVTASFLVQVPSEFPNTIVIKKHCGEFQRNLKPSDYMSVVGFQIQPHNLFVALTPYFDNWRLGNGIAKP